MAGERAGTKIFQFNFASSETKRLESLKTEYAEVVRVRG
jgi:hypothetical protein